MLLGFKAQQIPYIIIIRADRDKIDRINVKIYIVKSMKTNQNTNCISVNKTAHFKRLYIVTNINSFETIDRSTSPQRYNTALKEATLKSFSLTLIKHEQRINMWV